MKHTFLLFIIVSVCSLSSVAQNKLSPREILDCTSARMQGNGGQSACFTTTVFDGTTPKETISGTIDMLGQKYVMKTPAVCTWFNGKYQWNLISGNEEVTLVSPTDEELQTSSPMAFLGIYKHGFNLSSKKTALRGRNTWEVTLRNKQRKSEPSVIVVSIDRETYAPLCIRIRDNGNWTRISITDFRAGVKFSDDHFDFPVQAYPGYEIIDMQ